MTRETLLVTHPGRVTNVEHARNVAAQLRAAGFGVRVLAEEAAELALPFAVPVSGSDAADGVEIVITLGGDGTLLRGAELARPVGAPLLGVNLGRVGFLTEVEVDDLEKTVRHIVDRDYEVDERLTVDVIALPGRSSGGEQRADRREVREQGEAEELGATDEAPVARTWALNEVSVEKSARERMLELIVSVDGRPLSRWGCDGVICATPTGSTAYAFSAGGPVVWPDVEALLLVPISAHALFSRPLVIAPTSTITIDVVPQGTGAVMSCDGQRVVALDPGSRVEVRRGQRPVRVVRLAPQPFTDRLVVKFGLSIAGWRGNGQ